jgi:hypothetical protein
MMQDETDDVYSLVERTPESPKCTVCLLKKRLQLPLTTLHSQSLRLWQVHRLISRETVFILQFRYDSKPRQLAHFTR